MQTMRRTGTLILCYHRIAEGVDDPFRLCVRPSNFAAHLEEVVRLREPSTLDDLGLPTRRARVVVTFDDGYSDNLTNALPIVEAIGMPITVFVTSGMVGRAAGFWWDRLASLLRARPPGADRVRLSAGDKRISLPVGQDRFGSDLAQMRRLLVPLPVHEIERQLDALADEWSVASATPPDTRVLSAVELAELAASPLVTIGAHTIDHVRLHGRPVHEQRHTVAESKRALEDLLDRQVPHFAYPFGRRDDFDDDSVAAVQGADFETACTTVAGTARPSTDRHRLPRRMVMDWGRTRFRAQLQRWRIG